MYRKAYATMQHAYFVMWKHKDNILMQDIFVSFSEKIFMLMILVCEIRYIKMDKKYLLEVIKLSG